MTSLLVHLSQYIEPSPSYKSLAHVTSYSPSPHVIHSFKISLHTLCTLFECNWRVGYRVHKCMFTSFSIINHLKNEFRYIIIISKGKQWDEVKVKTEAITSTIQLSLARNPTEILMSYRNPTESYGNLLKSCRARS